MKSSLDVLDRYTQVFRDLINERAWGRPKTKRELLRLNSERDWGFLCSSMDIVEDASLAIENFLRFGLDGPTRHPDVGERYLRLYGILSATYAQQQVVLKLYKLMNVPHPKEIKSKLDALDIRNLRHKLASQSTDYRPEEDQKKIETYVVLRSELGAFYCRYENNETGEQHGVDLEKGIEDHCRCLIRVLDSVCEKAARTLLKGHQKELSKFDARLEGLRIGTRKEREKVSATFVLDG